MLDLNERTTLTTGEKAHCTGCDALLLSNVSTRCPVCRVASNTEGDEPVLQDGWIGCTVGRRYQILARLGAGATSVVYSAQILGRAERVAMKIIDLRRTPSHNMLEQTAARIRHEILSLVQVRSFHILRFQDFLEIDPYRVAIVTELIEGEGLQQLIEGHAPMAPARACELARQVAVGLADAHRHGVVHRDVKPANILVQPLGAEDEFVKIIDFGISTSSRDASATAGFLGTPAYAAPEHIGGGAAGPAADVYSLGVTLFEMLTATLPFPEHDLMRLMCAHVENAPSTLANHRPELAAVPALQRLLDRMLRKDPEARPTATEVAATLADLVTELSPSPDAAAAPGAAVFGRPTTNVHHPTLPGTLRPEPRRGHAQDPDTVARTSASGRGLDLSRGGGPWERIWHAPAAIEALALCHDRVLVGLRDGHLWSIATRGGDHTPELLARLDQAVVSVAVNRLGTRAMLATAGGELRWWEQGTRDVTSLPLLRPQQRLEGLVCDAEGLIFAAAGSDGTLQILTLDHGELQPIRSLQAPRPIKGLRLSEDGHVLAVTLDNESVWLVDPFEGSALALLHDRAQLPHLVVAADEVTEAEAPALFWRAINA